MNMHSHSSFKPGSEGPKNRPYQKSTGKSLSDGDKHLEAKRDSTTTGTWDYPEESAEVKHNTLHSTGGYKQTEFAKGEPEDEEDDEDIIESEYMEDDEEEF